MIDDLVITVLVENKSDDPRLCCEHGLSLWIEADGFRILLDTGAGHCLFRNAKALGIDPSDADALVLSHGHCDHTGALPQVLERRPNIPVYYHPDALKPRFSMRRGSPRGIGMPMDAIVALGINNKHASREAQEIHPGIVCSGEIPRSPKMQPTDNMLFSDAAGTQPDPLLDDQALVINCMDGLVVISGCCHAGIDPTLTHIRKQHPERPIIAVIGGLHLNHCDEAERGAHLAHLTDHGVSRILAGHCSGDACEALLAGSGDLDFSPLRAGSRWLVSSRSSTIL